MHSTPRYFSTITPYVPIVIHLEIRKRNIQRDLFSDSAKNIPGFFFIFQEVFPSMTWIKDALISSNNLCEKNTPLWIFRKFKKYTFMNLQKIEEIQKWSFLHWVFTRILTNTSSAISTNKMFKHSLADIPWNSF